MRTVGETPAVLNHDGHMLSTGRQPHARTDSTPLSARRQPRHGGVRGGLWTKHLSASRHMLHEPPGWAVDAEDLARARALGAETLRIVDNDCGAAYEAPLAAFSVHGFDVSRGFGDQVALRVGWFAVDGGVPELVRRAEREAAAQAMQGVTQQVLL